MKIKELIRILNTYNKELDIQMAASYCSRGCLQKVEAFPNRDNIEYIILVAEY